MLNINSSWNTSIAKGEYQRKDALFRHWLTADGSAGPSGKAGFAAEAGRYHLYVNQPLWHRTPGIRSKLADPAQSGQKLHYRS